MEPIVAIAQQKGGCGKTTLATHLAWAFTAAGHAVLLVDLDPQGHARRWLALSNAPSPSSGKVELADVLAHTPLTGQGPGLGQAVMPVQPGLDLAGGEISLAGMELYLARLPGRVERLAEHLADDGHRWEVVIIDTPPSLGLLTINALVAAGACLVPLPPDPFALHGARRLAATAVEIEEQTGHHTELRFLPVMSRRGGRLTRELLAEAEKRWGSMLLPLRLHRSVLFDRAAARGKVVAQTAPRSQPWQEVMAVADLLWRQWTGSGGREPPA
ncbi:MAG: ParA family protein [Acidobacteriota bacterium]|nr:ParA family protein [Acidobacteriota bacterium]